MPIDLYCGYSCTSPFYEEACLQKHLTLCTCSGFIFSIQIRCIIQVVCILKGRVTSFLHITLLQRLLFWTSKSVLAVTSLLIEAFALPMHQGRVRDHGLICCSCGSKPSSPLHVLTRCETFKLSLAIHRHHACVERLWWILYLHFKWVPLAGALSGDFHPICSRREITLMSAVVCPSEYWTIFKIMHM